MSGANPELKVTITNVAGGNQTLDYANVNVPAGIGLAIDTAHSPQPASYTQYASSSASTQLRLRNLGLAPGGNVTVAFFVNSTNALCTAGNWSTLAQSAANGNFFTFPSPTVTGGLSSLVAKSCKLAFQNEPTAALANKLITDSPYNPNVGGGVHNVTVVAEDVNGTPIAAALNGGSVNLTSSGPFDSPLSGFTGTGSSFASSSSAFGSLSATGTGGLFTLTAAATGFTSAVSAPPFAITHNGTTCSGACNLNGTDNNGNIVTAISVTGGFSFIGSSAAGVPLDANGNPPAGCQSWTPTAGVSGFAEFDGRTPGGVMTITYYVSTNALKARYGKNVGQQFVPLCFGAKPVVNGQAVDCSTPGTTPWMGVELDPSGAFTGNTKASQCGTDGYYWGILGSFQNRTIDPTTNPTVTSWNGSTNLGNGTRAFNITLPADWDARGGM